MCAAVYVLSTVTGYVLTSALLLKCPALLHRRKREAFLSRHISHRGGAGENLENTMTAFKHAVDLGTDMLELDCHLTKDEQVVVSHDANLQRVCGINADISEMAYAELPPYLCKLGVTFQRECFCEGGEDKRIPLLRDVFDAFPNTPINIDIKVNNDTLIKKVSELVVKYDREHLTVWGNARNQIVKKCYKENPHIPVLFSFPRVLQLLGLFYTGLLPFVPLKEEFLEIPMPSIITKLKDPDRLTRSQQFITWLADTFVVENHGELEIQGMFQGAFIRGQDRPCLTLIGSPNFGYRSVHRDLEAQIAIVTENEELQSQLQEEQETLYQRSTEVSNSTFERPDRHVKLWVKLVTPLIKNFF